MPDLKMPQINQVTVAGRLVRDPELRYTETKKAVCSFGIAVDTGSQENKKTYWGKVQCWEKVAEYVGTRLKKGRPVVVSGRMATEKWTDKNGQERSTSIIVASSVQALDWEDSDQSIPPRPKQQPVTASTDTQDDIPF